MRMLQPRNPAADRCGVNFQDLRCNRQTARLRHGQKDAEIIPIFHLYLYFCKMILDYFRF
jgi:hypothetical protein